MGVELREVEGEGEEEREEEEWYQKERKKRFPYVSVDSPSLVPKTLAYDSKWGAFLSIRTGIRRSSLPFTPDQSTRESSNGM